MSDAAGLNGWAKGVLSALLVALITWTAYENVQSMVYRNSAGPKISGQLAAIKTQLNYLREDMLAIRKQIQVMSTAEKSAYAVEAPGRRSDGQR